MDGSTVPCVYGGGTIAPTPETCASFWISTGIAVKVNPYEQWENKVVYMACIHVARLVKSHVSIKFT